MRAGMGRQVELLDRPALAARNIRDVEPGKKRRTSSTLSECRV